MNRKIGLPAFFIALIWGSPSATADTLKDIYELAVKNDATLKAAEATYRADRETKNIARAGLLPQINGSAKYEKRDTEDFDRRVFELAGNRVNSISDDDTEADSRTYSVSLDQPLFDLPAWFSFKSGKLTSKRAEADFAAAQQDLIIRVAEAYFEVLRTRENLEATVAEERAVKRQLEQTQQRFDVGLIPITDVHEARAVYDNTVARRLGDEAALGTAVEALTVLTGQSHSGLWMLSEDFPITTPEPQSRDQWVRFALDNNYNLKAATYGSQAAHETASSKKMEHLPKLQGSLAYNDFDEDGDKVSNIDGTTKPFETESEGGTVSVTLSVPLFSGGRISASRRQAYEQYNAALQQKINTQRQVVQQTRSLHLTASTDVQRVKARQQNIVSARSALDATQAGYEVGTRNIVDVLDARRALYGAIRDHANARFDYVLNILRLKRQAGTLSPEDIYDLNQWLEAPAGSSSD